MLGGGRDFPHLSRAALGREKVHDEARSGRPSLVIGDLVRKVNERVRDDRGFTITYLSLHFPQMPRTRLYDLKYAVQ